MKRVMTFAAALLLAALPSAHAQEVKIKFASANPDDSYHGVFGHAFKKHAEALSEGRIQVDVFLGGQLGSEQDNVNQVSSGILNMASAAVNNVTPFAPIVGFCSLPYMWNNFEEAWAVLDSPLRERLNDTMAEQANMRAVAWLTGGFRVLTNSKKPVRTPADLQGLRIRVPKNEIMIAAYKAWGINPVPMAWTEVFNALQQKVVDGQDNPYLTVHSMKFYEMQKYVTNIRYIFSIEPLIISEMVYQDLDEETQAMMVEAGKAATQHSAEHLRKSEAAIKEDLIARGMEISDPADDEKEFIERATNAVWPKFYDSIGGKEKLDRVMEILGRS